MSSRGRLARGAHAEQGDVRACLAAAMACNVSGYSLFVTRTSLALDGGAHRGIA